MSETFLEFMTRSRAELVRHALGHWQSEVPPVLHPDDRQDATRLCLELTQDLRHLIDREIKQVVRASPSGVQTLQDRRQALEQLCNQVHTTLAALRLLLPQSGDGSSDDGARLGRALAEVREAREHLIQRWPVRSPDELAEARRQIERGEGVDAETAFARIAGVDVETWQRRVEEHKRAQP
jgi:hypothetical protein